MSEVKPGSEIKNVAVIGCGIGKSHIEEGYVPHPDRFKVLAICDLDESRLTSVGDAFGIERRTKSLDEVLAMPDIDVVDLCTPPATHYGMILKALASGKHVVCEKPLVGSLAEVDAIIEAEKTARGKLMPIYQYRYGDGAMKARAIIDAGIAGKPYLGTVETLWNRDAVYYDNPWRGRWHSELGGVLMTHAIHLHDLATFLMGPVARLFARTATRVNAIETEDCVSSSWLMESGALVSASATLGSQEEISRLRLSFENVTFESNHEAYAPGEDPWRIIAASPEIEARIETLLADWAPVGRRFKGQMRAFHEALCGRGPVPVTSADARRSLELVTAFYQSAETGADVALPLPTSHPKYESWRPAA